MLDSILVIVDCLGKQTYFFAIECPFKIQHVAKVFLRDIVKIHGILALIASDCDKIFVSSF